MDIYAKEIREEERGDVMLWAFQTQSRTIADLQGIQSWSSCLGCHEGCFVVNSSWLAYQPSPVLEGHLVSGFLHPGAVRTRGPVKLDFLLKPLGPVTWTLLHIPFLGGHYLLNRGKMKIF